ncbi:MAG: sulfatase [Sedimentisphaeraceae bacterium JB056]
MKNNRRDFIKQTLVTTTYLNVLLQASYGGYKKRDVRRQRPNIIFLMSDQQRWDYVGKINPGVKTPALDKVAEDGVIFDQAVCQAPMCVPSRYSLMLGLYPTQIGVQRNDQYVPDYNLPSDTIAQALSKAGYQTAGFGKTHWCDKGCSTRGFEVRYVGQPRDSILYEKNAIMMGDANPDGLARYREEVKDYGAGGEGIKGYIGCTSKVKEEDHRDGWVFNQCLKFIDNGIDEDRPLFLYLSFLAPHAGHNVPEGFEGLYNIENMPVPPQPEKDMVEPCHASGFNRDDMYIDFWSKADKKLWQQMILRYRANCSWIDSMFGRVMDKLESKGILDNCLIVYISDHGEMLGERYYRFNKYCLYESSVRVPVIIGGTVVEKALKGGRDHRPVELVDIYPTILNAAGETASSKLMGNDLLGDIEREAAFCEFHENPNTKSYMWRKKDYKLIVTVPNCTNIYGFKLEDIIEGEFYHIAVDNQEWNNLYSDENHSAIRDQMCNELISHLNKYMRYCS